MSQEVTTTAERKPLPPALAAWMATRRHFKRSIVPRTIERGTKSPADRMLAWFLPWERKDYPGHRRGILHILQNRVSWDAVKKWRARDNWPVWALELVQSAIEARLEAGLAIRQDLERQIAEARLKTRTRGGFCVVRDDGRDRRGNWRR